MPNEMLIRCCAPTVASPTVSAAIFPGKADGDSLKLAVLVPAKEWDRP